MFKRYEVRLSGSGGQGLILAGVILAEAVAIYEGKNAVQSQSYGPEARGGASKSEVIISDKEIDYPKATKVDVLLSLTQESCEKYIVDLKPEGILIVDSHLVFHLPQVPGSRFSIYKYPFTATAKTEVGKAVVTNIVALGALNAIIKVVSPSSLEKAVLANVPKGTEEINKKALKEGYKLVSGK